MPEHAEVGVRQDRGVAATWHRSLRTGQPNELYGTLSQLIGPDTVNTLPETTIRALEDHRTLARTIDVDVADAERVMQGLATTGVDMDDVGRKLEGEGIAAFQESFPHVLGTLASKRDACPDG